MSVGTLRYGEIKPASSSSGQAIGETVEWRHWFYISLSYILLLSSVSQGLCDSCHSLTIGDSYNGSSRRVS